MEEDGERCRKEMPRKSTKYYLARGSCCDEHENTIEWDFLDLCDDCSEDLDIFMRSKCTCKNCRHSLLKTGIIQCELDMSRVSGIGRCDMHEFSDILGRLKMAKAIICDICKKVIGNSEQLKTKVLLIDVRYFICINHQHKFLERDLCSDCTDKLKEWLKAQKEAKEDGWAS